MGGVGKLGAGVAALVTGALAGCSTPGAPTSPDPVRFLLAGDPQPCRIVLGPLTPDPFVSVEEVGQIDSPTGTTFLSRGIAASDSASAPDLEVAGIDVRISTVDGEVSVSWQLPPTTVGFTTPSLDEARVRELLAELVGTADISSLARALASHIDGADVTYAGRAPGYDVGLAYAAGDALLVAGRGIGADQLDAFYGLLGADRVGDGWRSDDLAATRSEAEGSAVVLAAGSGDPLRDRVTATADEFLSVIDELLGDAEPTVAILEGAVMTSLGAGCDVPADHRQVVDAVVIDVAIAESDVGDVLRITFDGLPDDGPDPQLLHVSVGGVELVAPYQGGPTVDFPATLTHDESRLLADRLTR